MGIPNLRTCHFEASEDIMTKFKSQALHTTRIKYWKASGSGNPPSFIPALQKIAILGLKTKFSILFCTQLYFMCIDLHIYFLSYHKFYHKYHFLSFSSHALTVDAVVLGEGFTLELGWSWTLMVCFVYTFLV